MKPILITIAGGTASGKSTVVKEIIKHKQFKAPKFEIDKSVKDFYDFKVDSFKFVDYKYNDKKYKIEVAV